jgi:hypothetical protein
MGTDFALVNTAFDKVNSTRDANQDSWKVYALIAFKGFVAFLLCKPMN